MDKQTIIFTATAVILYFLVLYLVIKSAVNTEKKMKYEWAQMEFLAHIARQAGMPDERITEIFEHINKK